MFPSYLTPCFILKTDESSKGTWKSELSMLHSNYNRSSYNSKTDPVRNEKWNVNYLCKHLSITFHFPFPRCNRATADEGPWPRTHQKALTTTRPEHSNLAENYGHIPTPGPKPWQPDPPASAPPWQLYWQCNQKILLLQSLIWTFVANQILDEAHSSLLPVAAAVLYWGLEAPFFKLLILMWAELRQP